MREEFMEWLILVMTLAVALLVGYVTWWVLTHVSVTLLP